MSNLASKLARVTLTLAAATLAWLPLAGQAQDDYLKTVKEFELSDQNGNMHTLEDYADKDYVVMYIHGVGCPIARLAVPSYKTIRENYADQNVEFLMLNAFVQDDIERIRKEAEDFNVDMPILKDADQSVAKSMGVERTAEVFIIDPETREIHYRGPITDQFGYETQRMSAAEHYLQDALDTVLAGGTVDMGDIPDAKGCLVGYFLS